MPEQFEFEAIMWDLETGETHVVYTLAQYLEDAVESFEHSVQPVQLWEGFTVFVPSALSV